MPSLWKTASHIFLTIGIVAAMEVPLEIAADGVSTAAAAQAAIGNVAQQAKAVPGKLNSLLSKYAPGLAEVDMKRYTAKKDEFMGHIGQLSGKIGSMANKIASENPVIEKNFYAAQDVVSQHIQEVTDQVNSFASKFASENPGIHTAQCIASQQQFPGRLGLPASKCDPNDMPILANPYVRTAALLAGGAAIGAVAAPLAVAGLGFSTGGVVAGSIAAGMQASIGNVAAGSAFAAMQAVGTAPLWSGAIGATVGAVTGGTAAAFAKLKAKTGPHCSEHETETEKATNCDSTEADNEVPWAKEKVYICDASGNCSRSRRRCL